MNTRRLITVLTATMLLASMPLFAQRAPKPPTKPAPVKAAPKPPKPAEPVVSAYDRMDDGMLDDMLGEMHMTELVDAVALQPLTGTESVPQLWGKVKAMIAKSGSMAGDPVARRKLLDDAAVILQKIIDRTAGAVKVAEIDKALDYRLTQVDLYGRSQCAVNAESLMMLMGGEEDRRWIMEYTSKILTPGKDKDGNPTRNMLEDLQDAIDHVVGAVKEDPEESVNRLPALETLQHKLQYSSAWFKLYRGLASVNREERATLLESAIQTADKYAKGEWEGAEGPDPSSRLLQGEATTELALTRLMTVKEALDAVAAAKKAGKADEAAAQQTKADAAMADAKTEFTNAENYLKSALECEGVSVDLKVTVLYQRARNLIEAGKYPEALKAVDEYGPTITSPQMLGKDARVRADVNTALLKNHLYLRWAENTPDNAQAEKYRMESQKALLDFLIAHKDRSDIAAAFYKIIANKYRALDPKGLSPIFLYAIANDEFNMAMDEAGNVKIIEELKKIVESKPAVRKHLQKADELFTMILNDKSEAAISLQDVPKLVGVVEDLLDLGEAAADKSAKGGLEGLLNACTMYRNILAQGRSANVKATREKYIAAMVKLLSNAEWIKDPKVSVWFVDQGEQYAIAAAAEADRDKKMGLYQNSIKAYRQVPQSNQKMYMDAQHRSLNNEYDMITAFHDGGGDAGKIAGMSNEFITRLQDYTKLVRTTIKQVSDAAGAKPSDEDNKYLGYLKVWGADSVFVTAIVMYDYRNFQKEALDILDKLPEQWPDSSEITKKAAVYETRRHIERGDMDEAIRHIEEIRKSQPNEANDLMQMVIGQIRDQIHTIEVDPAKTAELKKLREKYLLFAKDLLKTHPGDYAFEQLLADALLQNEQFDEAFKLFGKLNKIEQDARAAFEKKIDEMMDQLLAEMEKAKGNVPAIFRLADEFRKAMKELPKQVKQREINPEDKGYSGTLALVLAYARKATDPQDALDRSAQVVNTYKAAVAGLRKDLKARIPRDSVNIAGMARLYKAQKKFGEAMDNYKQLVAGLEVNMNDKTIPEPRRQSYSGQYGQALLEKTQCQYELLLREPPEKRKDIAKAMILTIKRYRENDSQMWGRFGEFNAIEADLQKLVGGK